MSNLDVAPAVSTLGGLVDVAPGPVAEVHPGKDVLLGESTQVRRVLPNLARRLVGPWCFIDHYGPDDVAGRPGMQVPPHPHIGLQTVSWLVAGEVHHRDSRGSDALVRPGELGLMTSGAGIAHSEYSPVPHPELLHGVQLWVALPDAARHGDPAWEHHAQLPTVTGAGGTATVILGELDGAVSPGTVHSPAVGAELAVAAGAGLTVALEPGFEHALLVLEGSAEAASTRVVPGAMLYLGCGRRELTVRAPDGPARVMLVGGAPFEERIVMWWNFVARDNDEIVAARAGWNDRTGFADVPGFDGFRLTAPALPPGRLRPGGSTR